MAERMVDLVVKPCLDAVVLRPGDKLIIRVASDLTLEMADEYTAHVRELLPGIVPVLIGAEQLLAYRPDGGQDD